MTEWCPPSLTFRVSHLSQRWALLKGDTEGMFCFVLAQYELETTSSVPSREVNSHHVVEIHHSTVINSSSPLKKKIVTPKPQGKSW